MDTFALISERWVSTLVCQKLKNRQDINIRVKMHIHGCLRTHGRARTRCVHSFWCESLSQDRKLDYNYFCWRTVLERKRFHFEINKPSFFLSFLNQTKQRTSFTRDYPFCLLISADLALRSFCEPWSVITDLRCEWRRRSSSSFA